VIVVDREKTVSITANSGAELPSTAAGGSSARQIAKIGLNN